MPKTLSKKEGATTAVAVAQPAVGVVGEITASDLVIPNIRIAHKTGELGELFEPGSIVLNGEYALLGCRSDDRENIKEGAVLMTVTSAEKYYKEKIAFGGEEAPKTARTLDEVSDLGGSLEFGADKPWIACLKTTVCVKGDDPAFFPFTYNDETYAFATLDFGSWSSYNYAGKQILTASSLNFQDAEKYPHGLAHGSWELTTIKRSMKDNTKYWCPAVKSGKINDTEFAEWAATYFTR